MKLRICLLMIIGLITGAHHAVAQETRFFRITGPAATTITAFNPDGTLIWSNSQSGTNYTVQTCTSLVSGDNWVDYVQLPVTNGVNTNLLIAFNPPIGMALIPEGMFTMGNFIINGNSITNDPDITDAIPTNVYVSAFYIDVNLVSSNQWQSVYNWATNNGYGFVHAGLSKAVNHPVQTVDWYDCVKWCNARSQLAGLTPMYYLDAELTQIYTNGETDAVYVNWATNGYRLPTEAEWEKAARGGLNGLRFPWGNTISETQANYNGDTNGFSYDLGPKGYNAGFTNGAVPYTSPVGSFAPNGYGLYDMTGNVFEWCWDWYAGPPYPPGSPYLGGTNPRGSASNDEYVDGRVLRGDSWYSSAKFARCAYRVSDYQFFANINFGFRCARGF